MEKEVPHLDEYPFNILDVAGLLRLTVRRELSDSVYVDCPFCQKRKGRLNLNFEKNVWRCNRCGESGHMFELYARMQNISVTEAKLEIADALGGGILPELQETCPTAAPAGEKAAVEQSPLASRQEIDHAMRELLSMLTLTEAHRENLRERGLTDEQINAFGFKSTPSYRRCHEIPQRLRARSCTVAGVPGFYLDKRGRWMVAFSSRLYGIVVPVRGLDGLVCGAQIRLDIPLKDDEDGPEDEGAKYVWFSSARKHMGVSSGSPLNFIGDLHAHTVYVTEGSLKAYVAHGLTGRTFLSAQGVNNLGGVPEAFAWLSRHGTELIVEAYDMDKFNNPCSAAGASKIYALAKQSGLMCQSLTWNPNYKGVDDWQNALKQKALKKEDGSKVEASPDGPCRIWRFRIYQLDFEKDGRTKPFAFKGINALYKAGYQQPPAVEYSLVHDGQLTVPEGLTEQDLLERIFTRYGDALPDDYQGRSVAPSDVVEVYDDERRRYYYRDTSGFVPVRFSPALARPAKG